jgi:hypothetical protein
VARPDAEVKLGRVQPIFKPVRIEEIAAGLRVVQTKAGVMGR